ARSRSVRASGLHDRDAASLTVCESTDDRTVPLRTNMMLVASSPCEKMVAAGPYSEQFLGIPVQSMSPSEAMPADCFDLLMVQRYRWCAAGNVSKPWIPPLRNRCTGR